MTKTVNWCKIFADSYRVLFLRSKDFGKQQKIILVLTTSDKEIVLEVATRKADDDKSCKNIEMTAYRDK